jgi:hypothetical protein
VKRILGLFLLWLILVVVLGTSVGRHEVDYYRLIKHGVATEGTAAAAKPHNQIEYSFEVNHRKYTGIGRVSSGSKSVRVEVGDKLAVYYLPSAPNINCLGDPQVLFSAEMGSVLLVILLFPTAIILVLMVRVVRSPRAAA